MDATTDRIALDSAAPPRRRGKLFRKYVALFVAVVCVALIANGAFEIGFSYQSTDPRWMRTSEDLCSW